MSPTDRRALLAYLAALRRYLVLSGLTGRPLPRGK